MLDTKDLFENISENSPNKLSILLLSPKSFGLDVSFAAIEHMHASGELCPRRHTQVDWSDRYSLALAGFTVRRFQLETVYD